MKNLFKIKILTATFLVLTACGGAENGGESNDGLNENEHRIFVTSDSYGGDLEGVSGANTKCDKLAKLAGLNKEYVAIISDETNSALSNLTITGPIYIFKSSDEREIVATSSSALWAADSVDLLTEIQYDEKYSLVTSGVRAWTGTNNDGGILSGDNCSSWSSSDSSKNGYTGFVDQTDEDWTENSDRDCDETHRLYCISQD